MAVKKGKRVGNNTERLEKLEKQMEWVVQEAFQTLADSVAEQASACQAMLAVLAELHPDRRMVKVRDAEGRVFYQFRLVSEIEAERKAKEESSNEENQ